MLTMKNWQYVCLVAAIFICSGFMAIGLEASGDAGSLVSARAMELVFMATLCELMIRRHLVSMKLCKDLTLRK